MELPTDTSGHLEAVEPGQIESGRLADDGPGTADHSSVTCAAPDCCR